MTQESKHDQSILFPNIYKVSDYPRDEADCDYNGNTLYTLQEEDDSVRNPVLSWSNYNSSDYNDPTQRRHSVYAGRDDRSSSNNSTNSNISGGIFTRFIRNCCRCFI